MARAWFMQLRMLVAAAALCALSMSACGGGGGGSPLPAPTQSNAATPQTTSVSFNVPLQITSFPLPGAGGFSGTIEMGAAAPGSVDVTVSTKSPTGDFIVDSRLVANGSYAPVLFVTLNSAQGITLTEGPTIKLSLPSTQLVPQNYYQAVYTLPGASPPPGPNPAIANPPAPTAPWVFGQPGTWGVFAGPLVTATQPVLTWPSSLILSPNQPVYIALVQNGISQMSLSLSSPLVMGQASTSRLSVAARDGFGQPLQGRLSKPITFSSSETAGRATLGGSSISSLSQAIPLNYNGKADEFSITATSGSTVATRAFASVLPPEAMFTPPAAPDNPQAPFVLGSDGDLWTTALAPGPNGVLRITPSGTATAFLDRSAGHAVGASAIVKGGDGNVWLPYGDGNGGGLGLDRISTSGQVTSFPFAAALSSGSISSMTVGPDGTIWSSIVSGTSPNAAYAIAHTGLGGATVEVATLLSGATNLLFGPDKNLWFATATGVASMTPGGVVSAFAIAGAPGSNSYAPTLQFIVGPDGNFWAPYAFGTLNLLKISTAGSVVSDTPIPYSVPEPNTLSYALSPGTALPTPVPNVRALATDGAGNVYVADSTSSGLIRITPSGSVGGYPIFGAPASDGAGVFGSSPQSIAIGPSGVVYVCAAIRESGLVNNFSDEGGITTINPTLW